MSDIPLTQRYVVPDDGRRQLAWTSVRFTLRSRGHRLLYAGLVVFALLFQTLNGGWDPLRPAVLATVRLIVGGLAITAVWTCVVGGLQTYRSTRDRFFAGAVHESGFGDDELALRGPRGESRIPYAAMRSIRTCGDFAFVSTDGLGGHAIFPRALFPDREIDRINAASS